MHEFDPAAGGGVDSEGERRSDSPALGFRERSACHAIFLAHEVQARCRVSAKGSLTSAVKRASEFVPPVAEKSISGISNGAFIT